MDQRSTQRRGSSAKPVPPYRNKRFMAILAAALTFGAFVTVTQVSNAGDRRRGNRPPATQPCPTTSATNGGSAQQPAASASDVTVTRQNGRDVRNYRDDGRGDGTDRRRPGTRPNCTPTSTTTTTPTTSPTGPATQVLGTDCSESNLEDHDGFQNGNRCVSVSHGEVPGADKAPSLLITGIFIDGQRRSVSAGPIVINRGQAFEIEVSTRNLVRDRFLAAGQGFYYAEASFLDDNGVVRGHFHSACNVLPNDREAPDMEGIPAFFVATEDGGGGEEPDRIRVAVAGIATAGIVQCASWAGDGGHRTPMMQRANQRPAFDAVRIIVR
jgi:hypothetical protein